MKKAIENPNHTTELLLTQPSHFEHLAKTGCALCRGAGYVKYKPFGRHEDGLPRRTRPLLRSERRELEQETQTVAICRCVYKQIRLRPDLIEKEGKLYWLPRPDAKPDLKLFEGPK